MAHAARSSSLAHRQYSRTPQPPKRRDFGGNPLAHVYSNTGSVRLPAFGGNLRPGIYRPPTLKIANPVPLGLAGFALTTFLLSSINLGVRGLSTPSIVVAPALAYGGLIQLLAGMWELALGNTFGGFALSSYGGFWMSIAILLIPGGFEIEASYSQADFYAGFGLYILGWFIVTFGIWLCTLRSTVMFSSLFFTVWMAFIFLGVGYLDAQKSEDHLPNIALTRTGGAFGIIAGFLAWYLMLAGLLDEGNSFFVVPVFHFPWSEKGRQARGADKVAEGGDNV
ncbi:Accumulation of DYads [Elasticomyces elasticus]|nr:Accumulation of DYads [Elasticomyces elasticus]